MHPHDAIPRRQFLGTAAATASLFGAGLALAADRATSPAPATVAASKRKIKVGWVGCGGRGAWLAEFFKEHGGYEMHAMADYFQEDVDKCGDKVGVDKSRRFTGLSGYKKVLQSGVEALVILDIPYFYPEQAQAAVDAGCHVYIAKPVAVDVPGVLAIEAAGKQATAKKLCFHVDYQMSTDPLNVEVAQRIWDGGLGKLLSVSTIGNISGTKMPVDAPRGTSIEGVLNRELWLRDIALGCDIIGNFDIHSIDAAIWVVKERPVAATGKAKICRPNPVGDRHDFVQLYYECQSGMPWVHQSFSIPDPELEGNKSLSCDIRGELASARICYWGKSYLRGGPKHYGGGQPVNPYEAGAKRNVAMFHKLVSEGNCENPMIKRAVDSTLTTILGREAGHRGVRLTMDDILKENKRLNVDLTGLKS